jgi:hypothetical protein
LRQRARLDIELAVRSAVFVVVPCPSAWHLCQARSRVCAVIDHGVVGDLVRRLRPRWFLERSVYAERVLLQPRWAMSLMRGPMTKGELSEALRVRR